MLSVFGRVGRDAELRYTQTGTAVCSISLAYRYGRKDAEGKRPTQWIEIVAWGKQAEGLAQYITKGIQVKIDAKDVRVEQFQNREGQTMSKLVADLVDIDFAYDGGSQQQQQPQRQQQQARSSQPTYSPNNQSQDDYDFDDDIPF